VPVFGRSDVIQPCSDLRSRRHPPPIQYLEFDGVYTLGDSNAMGYGMPGYKGGQVDENGTLIKGTEYQNLDYLHCVHGSFQDVVRQGLGLDWEKTYSMNYPAFRIRDALYYLDALDADYYHELVYDYRLINTDMDAFGEDYEYDPQGTLMDNANSVFIDRLQEFDNPLIINQLCNADIFYSLLELAIAKVSETGTDNIPAVIEGVMSVFAERHAEFREDYPLLIQHLQKLSPNATIVLVGMFNPVKDLTIMDDSIAPLLNALQPLFDIINSDIRGFAEEYGCFYADISNAETLTIVNDVSIEGVINGFDIEKVYHATPEGYAYIGRQILRQVQLNNTKSLTTIKTDLGPVRKVAAVLVDGKSVSNWSYDEATLELTVSLLRTNAKSLTVTEVRSSGTYVSVYSLDWSLKDGYTATQRYVTLNAAATVTKFTNSALTVAKSLFSTLKSGIGKLFKNA